MLPGKKYKPEDFVGMAWRRKWLIVVPTVLIGLATFVVSLYLPDRYRASTSILIVPQRVPETYVRPTVTADLNERLQMISQQILSRTRLERIIQELDLYKHERDTMIMEDVVEQMRQDISINVGKSKRHDDASSFDVSYVSSSPRSAMVVTERLASLFVQENLEDRSLLADATSQFLEAQLEDARRRLVDHEKKLEAFRQRNNGQLPTQVQSNLQMMQHAQTQLQGTTDSINKDRDRLAALEKALADAQAAAAPAAPAAAAAVAREGRDGKGEERGKREAAGTAAQQLEQARADFAMLQLRLKPEHPDIGRAKRMIAELEAKAEAEALEQPLSAATSGVALASSANAGVKGSTQGRLASMQLEIDELRKRIETKQQEEARLPKVIASYEKKANAAPALESELSELNRDYATLQDAYTDLLKKSEQSKIAVNLERRQIGEQFKVLDGARLPEKPFSPNRLRINLMGIIAGLGLGVAIIGLLEYRDTSFKTDDDVVVSLALPVLAVIPAMITADERRRAQRRRLVVALSGSFVLVIAVAAVVVWRLRLLDAWVR